MTQNQNQSRLYQIEQNVLENIKLFFPHIEMSIQDLRNPSPEAVSKFYSAFLEELGVNTANLQQIQINQMTLISHVDMYNVSVPLLNQYQSINFFLRNININHFSVTDLVSPESKRTVYFFDALLKFLSYCDDRIGALQPECEKIKDLGIHRSELLSKIEILRNDINLRATERGQRTEMIKEMKAIREKEKEKLDEIMNEKVMQVNSMNAVKKLLEEDAEKEAQLIRLIKKLEENVMNFKEMIVKSPEKLQQEIDDYNQKKENCLDIMKNSKIQIEEKKRLTASINAHQEKQEERFQNLKGLLEMKMHILNGEQEKVGLLNKYNKILEDCEEQRIRITSQQNRLKLIQENIEQQQQRRDKQLSERSELLDASQKELESLISQREEKKQHLDEIIMQIKQLQEDNFDIESRFTNFKQAYCTSDLKLHSLEKNLVKKYENVISKLRLMNEKLLSSSNEKTFSFAPAAEIENNLRP